MRRHRIDMQRCGGSEVALGIRGTRRINITALTVEKNKHAFGSRKRRQILHRFETRAPETLEKRRLRLDDRDLEFCGLQHALAKRERTFGCVRQTAGFQQRSGGIDPHAQWAMRLDRRSQSGSETCAHEMRLS